MDELLFAATIALVFILVLCNPFTVFTVAYLCKRTGKYLVPTIAGILVNVVTLTLFVFVFRWWMEISDSYFLGPAGVNVEVVVLLVTLFFTLLHGLLLVGFVLLVIRERRLGQAMPSKLAMATFVASLVAVIVIVSPDNDDFESEQADLADKLLVAYVSANQDESVEFEGHAIHLGENYIYLDREERLEIHKLGPGFGQLDGDFYLWYEAGAKDANQFFDYRCAQEDYRCERGERDNYFVVSQTHFYSDEDEGYTKTMYYSPACDVLLGHREKDSEGRYADFVETFFSESCV